jgi:hypothetical protein
VSSQPTRRRVALLALAVLVSLLHGWLALQLPDLRIGDGSAERMPKRIEVAFVRELAPAAPPAAAPVVMARKAPRSRRAAAPTAAAASAPQAVAEPASMPQAAVEPEEARMAQAAAPEMPPEPSPPATAPASAAESAVAEAAASPASAASAPSAFEWPPSTRLSYTLNGNYRGEVKGSAQVEWVRQGTRYQVHLDVWIGGTQAAPLVGRRMTSDGELTERGLEPKRYDEETRALFRELRRRTILFEGEVVRLPNGKVLERVPGMQDAASQFVQLTWLFTTQPQLLRVGQRIELPLALPGNVDRWAYDVIEEATLDTPFGPLAAMHLKPKRERTSNRELVADAWFAPSLQYLPVRLLIRQDEATYIDLMLERLPQQAGPEPGEDSGQR